MLADDNPVAPHVGAWIETWTNRLDLPKRSASRPTWARGLKLAVLGLRGFKVEVAPHVGAWIETFAFSKVNHIFWSRPTWARGLKPRMIFARRYPMIVAPHEGAGIETRVNGAHQCDTVQSRPTWARGLKQIYARRCHNTQRRAPRGRVD